MWKGKLDTHIKTSEDGYITLKTYMNFLFVENSRASLRFTT
jgi:hypothetical protein